MGFERREPSKAEGQLCALIRDVATSDLSFQKGTFFGAILAKENGYDLLTP